MDDDKPITRKDLSQFSDAILNGVEVMVTKVSDDLRGEIAQVRDELKEEISGVRNELSTGLKNVEREINDLKVDTPTRKEFDDLRERVDRFHPSN
ncbi:MAG: hypothetical protein DWQ07_25910 [Chloroflexi bacterium]|nr:MAG: hypothetical protein DWQ07_25910 [Chloroflexota bacterium]